MTNSIALEKFSAIVSGPDENINLAEAALLIAGNEYPGLDAHRYLARFDTMAEELRNRLQGCGSVEASIAALNAYLFVELGFSGNLTDFDDPRNSFLNDVLDRKLGIPITLSLVYMEVGRRVGLPLAGLSFPGHFLVKLSLEEGELVLDPFSKGITLSKADLEQRLQDFTRSQHRDWRLAELLQPANNKEVMARMLRNLKNIYLDAKDYEHALDTVNYLLAVTPGAPAEIRDRASIHERLDCYRAAVEDYQRYLLLSPGADDAIQIQTRLANLRLSAARLH